MKYNIQHKKHYLPPCIKFEEIEEDDGEMLLAGSPNSDTAPSPGSDSDVGNEFSLSVEFDATSNSDNKSSDFVINDY